MRKSRRNSFSDMAGSFNKKKSQFGARLWSKFKRKKNMKEDLMTPQSAFASFDTDGSGELDVAEVRQILTRSGGGAALTDEEVNALIAEFDSNGDGVLQYNEFAVLWGSINEQQPAGSSSSTALGPAAAGSNKSGGGMKRGQSSKTVGGGSGGGGGDDAAAGAKLDLQPASELEAVAAAELSVAERSEKRASAIFDESLSARLGRALLQNENARAASKGGAGSKEALSELMRAWSKKKDATVLSKPELRQAVRGDLKVTATNKEIDGLFDDFDKGTLDVEIELATFASLHQACTLLTPCVRSSLCTQMAAARLITES